MVPAFLGHIPVSMIVLVVVVSSAIVLMSLQGSVEDRMWCRVKYVFGASYQEDQDLRGIISWEDRVTAC